MKLSSILNSFMSDLEKSLMVSKHPRQNVDLVHAVWPEFNEWHTNNLQWFQSFPLAKTLSFASNRNCTTISNTTSS